MFFTYSEFEEYRKSMKNDAELKWLPEFEAWLKEYYEVEFMPSSYKQVTTRGMRLHNISLVVMNETDVSKVIFKNCPEKSPERWRYVKEFLTEKANEYALLYQEPIMNDKDCLRVVDLISFFESYLYLYLLGQKTRDLNKQIESVIEEISHSHVHRFGYYACVFPTREEAYNFLSGEKYQQVQEEIYKILKPFDEFDVLTRDRVDLLVDYQSHYEKIIKICPYTRWMADNDIRDVKNYNQRILNGQF